MDKQKLQELRDKSDVFRYSSPESAPKLNYHDSIFNLFEYIIKKRKSPSLIKEVIEFTKISSSEEEWADLLIYATYSPKEYLKALIDSGVDVNSADAEGNTALHALCKKETYGNTSVNDLDKLNELLYEIIDNYDPDVNVLSKLNQTPILKAVDRKNYRAVSKLLPLIDFNIMDSLYQNILLSHLIRTGRYSNDEVIMAIKKINKGAFEDSDMARYVTKYRFNPLPILEEMIKQGYDLNTEPETGRNIFSLIYNLIQVSINLIEGNYSITSQIESIHLLLQSEAYTVTKYDIIKASELYENEERYKNFDANQQEQYELLRDIIRDVIMAI